VKGEKASADKKDLVPTLVKDREKNFEVVEEPMEEIVLDEVLYRLSLSPSHSLPDPLPLFKWEN
jgi:hypothetical protein